jgi:hypothetical protein
MLEALERAARLLANKLLPPGARANVAAIITRAAARRRRELGYVAGWYMRPLKRRARRRS